MSRGTRYVVASLGHCLVEERDRIIVRPLTDLVENDEGLRMYCNLPGVRREDLELSEDNGSLLLRGRTRFSCLPGKVRALEFDEVVYESRFSLPPAVDSSRMEASLRDGVLTVFLPFPRGGAQRIPITRG